MGESEKETHAQNLPHMPAFLDPPSHQSLYAVVHGLLYYSVAQFKTDLPIRGFTFGLNVTKRDLQGGAIVPDKTAVKELVHLLKNLVGSMEHDKRQWL